MKTITAAEKKDNNILAPSTAPKESRPGPVVKGDEASEHKEEEKFFKEEKDKNTNDSEQE